MDTKTKTKKRPAKRLLAPGDGNCINVTPILSAPTVLDVSSPVTLEIVINTELPETLDEAMERVVELEEISKTAKLLGAWGIGRILEAAGAGKYGNYAVKELAGASGLTKRILQEYLKCYRAYPDFNVVKAFGLDWSSVRELLNLPKDADRTRVAKASKKENLTCRQVRDEVREVLAKEKTKKPKAPKKPLNPEALVKKIHTKILIMLQEVKTISEPLPELLRIIEDESLTPEDAYRRLTKALKQVSQAWIRMVETGNRNILPLGKVFDEDPETAKSGTVKKGKK